MTELRLKVLQVIQERNKEWPVTGRQIVQILKLDEDPKKFGAKLRQVVNGLRQEGYPICAKGSGYYYPQDLGELKEYMLSFKGRIENQMEAYKGMQKIYDQMHSDWILQQQRQALDESKVTAKQQTISI